MKTPMQLRWETEYAKKLQQQKESPLVETDALLTALGQHMQKGKAKRHVRQHDIPKAEDLD